MSSVAGSATPPTTEAASTSPPPQEPAYYSFPPPKHEEQKKTCMAKARGWIFLAFLIGFALLSGTVLRKPIMDSEMWLKDRGTMGLAIFGVVSWAFIMIGGSANLIDLISGFVYGGKTGFILSYVIKLLSTTFAYLAGRYLLRDMLMNYFFKEYVWLAAMAKLVEERPWQSNILLRLSVIPAAVKSYGLGAIQDPPLPFFTCALIVMALLSWVLADLGAKLQNPADIFKAKSKGSRILEIVGIIQAEKEAEMAVVAPATRDDGSGSGRTTLEEGPEAEEILFSSKDIVETQVTPPVA
eukprot:evm.model.NODE_3311_length_19320_cov_26.791149.4